MHADVGVRASVTSYARRQAWLPLAGSSFFGMFYLLFACGKKKRVSCCTVAVHPFSGTMSSEEDAAAAAPTLFNVTLQVPDAEPTQIQVCELLPSLGRELGWSSADTTCC